ncbi:tripartite tricarboxylate transporter substrate binding protein [Brachybacterium equifaecis]
MSHASSAVPPDPSPDSPANPPAAPTRRTAMTVLGALVAAGAIGTATAGSILSASSGSDVRSSLSLVAPAAAGGGWDAVARQMQQAQRENSIVNNTQVLNMPGAGGTIALNNFATLSGQSDMLLIGGTGLMAGTIQFDSKTKFTDITPLAVLVEEYDAIVVPANSPYQDLAALVADWTANPGAVPWTGGGSFDQLVVTDLAVKAGLTGADVNYISSDGGGEALAALLNGTAKAAASGLPDTRDQIEAGRLRALALIAKEPIEGLDVPTAIEQGYDVTLSNWRSVSAPAGLEPETVDELVEIVLETVATPEWADAMEKYAWTENVITGDELTAFLADQETRIRALYEEMNA